MRPKKFKFSFNEREKNTHFSCNYNIVHITHGNKSKVKIRQKKEKSKIINEMMLLSTSNAFPSSFALFYSLQMTFQSIDTLQHY